MSFLARRAAASARVAAKPAYARVSVPRRSTTVRFNSTAPAGKSSNCALYASIALIAAGGAGYWVYSSNSDSARGIKTTAKEGAQAGKALAGYTPTKEDYQKVYNKVASILDAEYDGASICVFLGREKWRRLADVIPLLH